LLLALPDGRVLGCESARAAEGGVQGGGEEARHGEVLRSFRVAGRFAARSDWQADRGDFEREVDRALRTIAFDDQGGAGADDEARRPIGAQCGGPSASTQSAGGKLSPQDSPVQEKNLVIFGGKLRSPLIFNGAPGVSRTRDPLLRRQMLYPAE